MDGSTQAIITRLKAFKQQGLTFYQATEQLKQQGYTQEQISEAADQYDYAAPTPNPVKTASLSSNTLPPASSKSYAKLGNALLADKERSTRPYAYVALVIPSAYLGQQIYRFWLNRKFWGNHGDPHYLWANNLGWYFLSGAIGGAIAIAGLKIYFYRKDKRYKEIDKKIDSGSDY